MCLSTVYTTGKDQPEQVCNHVSSAQVEDGKVTFTDIMGVQTVIEGTIESVDLVDNKIFVRPA